LPQHPGFGRERGRSNANEVVRTRTGAVGGERAAAGVAIFAVALAVRLAHVWQMRGSPFFTVLMGDSRSYDEWARRIAGGEWIGREVFYQAPLYPYFLGVLYAIAGHHMLLVRIVQAILGSLACVFLATAGGRFFSPRVGLFAGLILALYAPAIFFDGLIQKSTLDVFFVCLALWLVARIATVRLKADATEAGGVTAGGTRTGGVRLQPDQAGQADAGRRRADLAWLLLGLAIGALTLTRENAIVFTAVIVLWTLTRRDRAHAAAAFLLGVAIVVLPVAIRNSLVGGGFYVTTSQLGPNFYIGNNARSDGTYQSLRYGRGAPEYERQDATELAERAAGRPLTPAEVSSYWTGQALDFIAGRPGDWLKLVGRKAALLVNATEMLDTESQESHAEWSLPLRITGIAGHFGILVPLAVLGLIVSWPHRSRLAVLYAMLVVYAASVVLFYVFARYRYPLVPFLILFAAAGLDHLVGGVRLQADHGAPVRLKPDATNWNRVRLKPDTTWALATAAVVAIFANWPILSADMNRAVTEHNLGAALQSEGRYDEAIAHYRRATALRSDYAPAYNNLASSLNSKGQTDDAIATYEQALRLQPDYPEAHYNLANALLQAGRRDEAVAHFQRALQSMSASADVHNNLGIALMGAGKVAEAVDEFRQAIQIEPDSAKAHRNLGDALTTMGARGEGIEHLRRAVALEPNDGSLHYDLGSALLEAGALDDAIAEFRAALRLDPQSVEAHNNLGIALGSQGKLQEAIGEFQAALKVDSHFADAQRNLAMALAVRKKIRN
jgi:tetratricopeptide (TPR) repeat protein